MNCPKCKFENPGGVKYCGDCGTRLESPCPKCNYINPPQFKFCGNCGHRLEAEPSLKAQPLPPTDSERKYVTVLFSDMSGYTAMTEKLDPEETKEIMGKIFGEISKVVAKYGGFIEKFIGDAVMALFGAPTAHEDDPVRAIKVALEIHDIVSTISPRYEKRIGKPLVMHTGIYTGLVVTGEVNLERGTHGVLGDTINMASRFSGLAKPGEIVISPDTYHQSEGYFTFEPLGPTTVKGKTKPVKPYKVLSPREKPTKTHRLSGLRAELIGRKMEMSQLQEALNNLKQGKGSIFSVVGDAGTGKSRLIEEFKNTLDLNTIQWLEGHSYAYSQNIPYFPLIDLLRRAWQIKEEDSPEQVRNKVETGAGYLIGERNDLIPYIGSLYSIKYPEIENVSPEYWKARLHEAIQLILANLCKRSHTIICIEDLHWADPSSIELLRNILSDFRYPAIFLCIYRPSFSLFTSRQINTIKSYQEIFLYDLSPSDAQIMVESLLKTEAVPGELKKFIRDRVEGNPFYLEEVINSLLETETLVRKDDSWRLTKPLIEVHIPSTIQGVISARLDRLETETKRILQEASVIGRAFLYEILKRITELREYIDESLIGLERLDLIRTRFVQPDLEYIFKHALTQEVVYSGLLKKERQSIHEKIGQVMERLFHDRLLEFCETLAFHYTKGTSTMKAVAYLMKAGEKSVTRYTLDEAHRYYREAFELLTNRPEKSKEEKELLLDLILRWAVVYHHRAVYNELEDFLKAHESFAVSLGDKARLGMLYARLGGALEYRDKLEEAYEYSSKALNLGEESGDQNVIGYALAFLTFACADLGRLDEAIAFGKRVQEMDLYISDSEIFRISSTALGMAYFARGEARKAKDLGKTFIEYGKRSFYVGCIADGYLVLVWGQVAAGDFSAAIECALEAIRDVALEPAASLAIKVMLGYAYVANEQYQEADDVLQEILKFNETYGYEKIGTVAQGFYSVVTIVKGNLRKGIELMENVREVLLKNDSKYRIIHSYYLLGRVYLKIVQGGGKIDLTFIRKNICFLIRNLPFAARKAEDHFQKAIETAREIGAKGMLGQCYLDLGQLYVVKKKNDEARKYIRDAIQLFEECEADVFLKQAKEALASL